MVGINDVIELHEDIVAMEAQLAELDETIRKLGNSRDVLHAKLTSIRQKYNQLKELAKEGSP